ncbi:MAG: hypothetical protein Fur0032_21890 [Terrimicrobiaceae bacterium]
MSYTPGTTQGRVPGKKTEDNFPMIRSAVELLDNHFKGSHEVGPADDFSPDFQAPDDAQSGVVMWGGPRF